MVRILILDDNPYDADLILKQLIKSEIVMTSKIVKDKGSYIEGLKKFKPDVVFCDFNISHDFTAINAIRILNKDFPEVQFVLVTGTMNEEVATICITECIDDFVLKSNLKRLPLTLVNAITKRKIILQKKETLEKLVQSEIKIRDFASYLQNTIEEERFRIARELHDELGQQLSGLKMDLAMLKQNGSADLQYIQTMNDMTTTVNRCIKTVKNITTELRPSILDTFGLIPAIEWLCAEFEKKSKINCLLKISINKESFSKEIATCFFRVCQEALTNILKHSGATEVVVRFVKTKFRLLLEVKDNGRGLISEKLISRFSYGLTGMRERAHIIGAEFKFKSIANKGTTIILISKLKKK